MSSLNGGHAHYIIESKVQWKPFWLATQQYPQNDWLGGNFPYTMTYVHGPYCLRNLAWLRGGTTDVTNARTCHFFAVCLIVFPQISTLDLCHCILRKIICQIRADDFGVQFSNPFHIKHSTGLKWMQWPSPRAKFSRLLAGGNKVNHEVSSHLHWHLAFSWVNYTLLLRLSCWGNLIGPETSMFSIFLFFSFFFYKIRVGGWWGLHHTGL